jgi:microcystin-dependent protein
MTHVGEIRMFAGAGAPAGWLLCDGQEVAVATHGALYELIGNTYGGAPGGRTFRLPDLRGRIPIHQGNGFLVAQAGGAEEVELTASQIPALAPGDEVALGAAGRPHPNVQPYLCVNFITAAEGVLPATDPLLAEIRIFAFPYAPPGWAWCDGHVLPVTQHGALFSVLGARYGGDGTSTFGLPDLRGRAPLHAGAAPGLSAHELGDAGGSETVALGAGRGAAGRGVARSHNNMQPYLTLAFGIALEGAGYVNTAS